MHPHHSLESINEHLDTIPAVERIRWAYPIADKRSHGVAGASAMIVLTSGGEFSAITPHLVSAALPQQHLPLLFIDTGYYRAGTYHQVRALSSPQYRLHVYSNPMTPAMQEAQHGSLEHQLAQDFDGFVDRVKLQPFRQAIADLKPVMWISGTMRWEQTEGREHLRILERKEGIYRLHPIADWTEQQARDYLAVHNLPKNPDHFDLTKGPYQKKQCGMHTHPVRGDYQI